MGMGLKLVFASFIAACFVNPALSQSLNPDRFAVALYTGPRAQPLFTGDGARFANVRSRIREAFVSNEIAAGHFIVLQIGCGTSCTSNIVGDVRTGRLMDFPIGGEGYPGVQIITDPKSKLFIAKWSNEAFSICRSRHYSLEGSRFVQVGQDEFENKSCFD